MKTRRNSLVAMRLEDAKTEKGYDQWEVRCEIKQPY